MKKALILTIIAIVFFMVIKRLERFKGPTVPIKRRRGVGDFGAFRSAHPQYPHQGQDYFAKPGQTAFAPISGKVRIAKPYPNDGRFSGVEITGKYFSVKVFYIDPSVQNGDYVLSGFPIGEVQDLSLKYGQSFLKENHIHVEVRKNGVLKNPDSYFNKDTVLPVIVV